MPISNGNFFSIPPLDVEHKMILPTARLYQKLSFKFNALYQDIQAAWNDSQREALTVIKQTYQHPLAAAQSWYEQTAAGGARLYNRLSAELQDWYGDLGRTAVDVHASVATAAHELYQHPAAAMTAWYQHAGDKGGALMTKAQAELQPIYQQWQTTLNVGKAKADRAVDYLQNAWEHPQQTALSALEPVTRSAASAAAQAEHYLQLFLASPSEFTASMLAPLSAYIKTESASAKAALIDSYHTLVDMASLIAAQPGLTLHALYNKTLSALLNVYYDVVSSLLVTV